MADPTNNPDPAQSALSAFVSQADPGLELDALPPDASPPGLFDDDEEFEQLRPAAMAATAPAAAVAPATVETQPDAAAEPKALLDLNGFYISSGAGVYDGATREGEEPRDSFFVDIQDYGSGKVQRIWGVHLGELMENGTASRGLKAGDRIRLMQRPKKAFARPVIENGEQRNQISYANGWEWERDTSPLPSQLAHLIADINVDQELEKIAIRYNLTPDHPTYGAWFKDQKDRLAAVGDDPSRIKAWISNQKRLGMDEETQILVRAAETKPYLITDEQRSNWVKETQRELRDMEPGKQFDFLMGLDRAHLLNAHDDFRKRAWTSVTDNIEKVVAMMTPAAKQGEDLDERREGMRRALTESVRGLTADQANAFLRTRLQQAFERSAGDFGKEPADLSTGGLQPLLMPPGASADAYDAALKERLSQAADIDEKRRILDVEVKARQVAKDVAEDNMQRITRLHQRLAVERDLDVAGMFMGHVVAELVKGFENRILQPVKNILADVTAGDWRRNNATSALDELHAALDSARATPQYQAFVNDPRVQKVANQRGVSVEELVGAEPSFAASDVAREHSVAMQDPQHSAGPTSAGAIKGAKAGIFEPVVKAADGLLSQVSKLGPNHLLKNGQLNQEWLTKFQDGVGGFAKKMGETLMPDNVREHLQELLKQVMQVIEMVLEAFRSRVLAKGHEEPNAAPAGSAP